MLRRATYRVEPALGSLRAHLKPECEPRHTFMPRAARAVIQITTRFAQAAYRRYRPCGPPAGDGLRPRARLALRAPGGRRCPSRARAAQTKMEANTPVSRYTSRRAFLSLLGSLCGAATFPLAARARPQNRTYRIGVLEQTSQAAQNANFDAFREGLREQGYVEGHNLIIEYRSADERQERYPALAAELVRLNVDVILTRGTPAVLAVRNATGTIPVVMAAIGDPLAAVTGAAQPRGNVTGLTVFSSELESKRLELIREVVPRLRSLGVVYNMGNPTFAFRWKELEKLVQSVGIEAHLLDVQKSEDVERAFETSGGRLDALVVAADGVLQANRGRIAEIANAHKLPAIYAAREFIDAGGLMSYGPSYRDLYRRSATFVAKILNGAKAADLPVEEPTRFELVVNLKAAKTLGLDMPDKLLALADEVIE